VAERLADASYPPDDRLLDELREAWRAIEAARAGLTSPIAALRPLERFALALSPVEDGAFAVTRLTRHGDGSWHPTLAGDGLSALVAGAPSASERSIEVDQTNASVVVGERIIVKWFRTVGPGPSRAAILLTHLGEVGFGGIPAPLGRVCWRSPDGAEYTLAQGDAYLPGARDGWEWCVERAERADASVGAELGSLVAGLHRALATPSAVILDPVVTVEVEGVEAWRHAALDTLELAIDVTDGPDGEAIRRWAPTMRHALDGIAWREGLAVQPVHGDLHVGQVLEWSGGLAVIDFDGNPTLGEEANALRQPLERDVAQMLSSIDHVGRVVIKRRPAEKAAIEAWIAAARDGFLGSVGTVDGRLVDAFEVEQECRELVYAARYLRRWRYAPMAALAARFGAG
jgi:maltokinase